MIVRFLALLEMYKQGWVELEQPDRIGDLEVIWIGDDEQVAAAASPIDDYEG